MSNEVELLVVNNMSCIRDYSLSGEEHKTRREWLDILLGHAFLIPQVSKVLLRYFRESSKAYQPKREDVIL